ncbi:MAG: hypothetical protein AB7F59_14330 [Bdellovibrionales bacterium]
MTRTRTLLLTIFFIVLLAVFFTKKSYENKLREKILATVHENCKSCKLEISSLKIHLFARDLSLRQIKFTAGRRITTAVEAQIEKISLSLTSSPFDLKNMEIDKVEIESPQITVIEGDEKTGSHPLRTNEELKWNIEKIFIYNGKFKYLRESPDRTGVIHMNDIQVTVENLNSATGPQAKLAQVKAKSLLENSGQVEMNINTAPFEDQTNVDLDIRLSQYNLKESNDFFKPIDQAELSGEIVSGFATSKVRGPKLISTVEVKYKNLDVQFFTDKDRTDVANFFMNVMADAKFDKKSTDESKPERTRTAHIVRKAEETLISFILRGLKDASLEVATTN